MPPEMWIHPRNWDHFQHRDAARSNALPWIKCYTELLSDEAYLGLTDRRRALLHCVWMEYARSRRRLTNSTRSLSHRFAMRVLKSDLDALSDAGFIEISASMYASHHAGNLAGGEESREEHPPNPPQGGNAKVKKPKRPKPTGIGPSYEDKNPFVCGVGVCRVREATEALMAEHREVVHGITPSNGHDDPAGIPIEALVGGGEPEPFDRSEA